METPPVMRKHAAEWERADEVQTGLHMHTRGPMCALVNTSVSCWPSWAHVWERVQRKQRQLEGEREETACATSMLTLHFSLIHHVKQKGHWLWEENTAQSGVSCLHADNMLILPTRSNTQQTAQWHSWTMFHTRMMPTLQRGTTFT